jgi:hypothetical protein
MNKVDCDIVNNFTNDLLRELALPANVQRADLMGESRWTGQGAFLM